MKIMTKFYVMSLIVVGISCSCEAGPDDADKLAKQQKLMEKPAPLKFTPPPTYTPPLPPKSQPQKPTPNQSTTIKPTYLYEEGNKVIQKKMENKGLSRRQAEQEYAKELEVEEQKFIEKYHPQEKSTPIIPKFKLRTEEEIKTPEEQGKDWHDEFVKLNQNEKKEILPSDDVKADIKMKNAMWEELKEMPSNFVKAISDQFRVAVDNTKTEIDKLKKATIEAQQSISSSKKNLFLTFNSKKQADLKAQIESKSKELAKKQGDLEKAKDTHVKQTTNLLKASKLEIAALKKELNAAPKDSNLKSELKKANTALKNLEKEAKASLKELESKAQSILKELNNSKIVNEQLQAQLEKSTQNKQAAESEYNKAKNYIKKNEGKISPKTGEKYLKPRLTAFTRAFNVYKTTLNKKAVNDEQLSAIESRQSENNINSNNLRSAILMK